MRHPAPLIVALLAGSAAAQAPQQQVSPPKAQAWIDVATFSGFGMPGAGANPMAALGGMFGGGSAKNSFGQTQSAAAGRWVDVTLLVRANPGLAEAQQTVPAAFLSPALNLRSPKVAPTKPVPERDDEVVEPNVERPRGRMLMYWGCGGAVRAGQPRVLDFAGLSPTEMAQFFVTRRATQRGAHSLPGRPSWPNPDDARMVPPSASLAGEHAFGGNGVPDNFRFQIPAGQDLMPALALRQKDADGATELGWTAAPAARAYFAAAMGAGSKDEVVVWTSSELPETGFGLTDYQTNPAVDRWLKDKVLLPPTVTSCTIPKGVFGAGGGGLVKLIGYGNELNLAHPPRPADPKQRWDPDWSVKVRVKSVASAVLGMPEMGGMPPSAADESPPPTEAPAEKKSSPFDMLRGVLGK